MRTNRIFRALAVLLAAVTVLSFAGCGEMALLFTELPAADVQQWKTGDPITQTKEMLGLEKMKQVASQGGLTLYMNEKTSEIAVKTADGTVCSPTRRTGWISTRPPWGGIPHRCWSRPLIRPRPPSR